MLSIFLGKFLGLLSIVMSLAYFTNPHHCRKVIHDITTSHGLSAIAGSLCLLVGFLIVLNHNIWTYLYQIVVSLVGWVILVSGLLLIFIKESTEKLSKKMRNHHGYTWSSLIILIVGVYLVYMSIFHNKV